MSAEQRIYCNLTSQKPYLLKIDEACLRIINSDADQTINVLTQSTECYECSPWYVTTILPSNSTNLIVNTSFPTELVFQKTDYGTNFTSSMVYQFEEYGDYGLSFINNRTSFGVITTPANAFLPILYASIAYILLGILCMLLSRLFHHSFVQSVLLVFAPADAFHRDLGQPNLVDGAHLIPPDGDGSAEFASKRLHCIDVFRGICIAVMIFVNYGGGKYWFFQHSSWNGLTIADLVFPWFMWLMGVSLVISIRSRLRRSVSRYRIFWQIFKRSVILFALGIMLNSMNGKNDINYLRIPGVLQRFGMAYFIVASLEAACLQAEDNYRFVPWSLIRDIATSWFQWLIMLCLVILHSLLTFYLHVPHCGKGYLGPGGVEDYGKFANCTGGAAGYIDRIVFGWDHIYQRPSCKRIYDTTVPFDPEGLLGTITAAFTVFLGVQAGKILVTYPEMGARLKRWLLWSLAMGILGGGLCGFSQNEGVIPVNKNLWSLSYVFALSCMAFFLLGLLYYITDVRKWWKGHPFMYAGMNAILLYIGHEMTKKMFPFSWKPIQQTHLAFLFVNLWGTTLWIIASYVLYYKKLFFSI